MARPIKWRKVCCLPKQKRFGPLDSMGEQGGFVAMTIEEYETIRLIDIEGFTQEKCAGQMNIARTTAQLLYNTARKKVADSLVNGNILVIEGGTYKLCDGLEEICACGGCRKHRHRVITQKEQGGVFDENGDAGK